MLHVVLLAVFWIISWTLGLVAKQPFAGWSTKRKTILVFADDRTCDPGHSGGWGGGGGDFLVARRQTRPQKILGLGRGLAHQYETVDGRIQQELERGKLVSPREATASARITTSGRSASSRDAMQPNSQPPLAQRHHQSTSSRDEFF